MTATSLKLVATRPAAQPTPGVQRRPQPAARRGRNRTIPLAPVTVTARDIEQDVVARRVDCPYEAGAKVETPFNRRIDILEQERSAGRISVAAYMTGREVQATFERAARLGLPARSWDGGSRVDAAAAHETAIAKGIDAARAVDRELRRLEDAVGAVGARLLRQFLAEGATFAGYAVQRGQGGERGAAYAGARFRGLLEDLAEFRAARGRG